VTEIRTERLLLRPLNRGDLEAIVPLCADEEVMRYIGAGGPRDRAATKVLLDHLVDAWGEHGFGLWGIIPDGEDAPVGWAGLGIPSFLPPVMPAVEADWLLARDRWGRGYATEAAGAVLDHGFREIGLDRIIACVYPDNVASIRVAERLGFTRYTTEIVPANGWEIGVWELFAPSR
jgi:RimJ/RimL family protein N-acetyltransferase